jgi:hypothetical protein
LGEGRWQVDWSGYGEEGNGWIQDSLEVRWTELDAGLEMGWGIYRYPGCLPVSGLKIWVDSGAEHQHMVSWERIDFKGTFVSLVWTC